MGIMQMAANLTKQVTTDTGGFAIPVIFATTDGHIVLSKTCKAVPIYHGFQIDERGMAIVAPTSRIMVSELALRATGFPTRDSNNKLSLTGVSVSFTDIVTGIQATFLIREAFANSMTGLTSCTLGLAGTVTPPGRTIIGWTPATIIANPVTSTSGLHQLLPNGDTIPSQYILNDDGTMTVPYMAGYAILSSFFVDNNEVQNIPYNKPSGTFSPTPIGAFIPDVNQITFDAVIPIWQS